jgi:uncharacterized protein
MARFEGFAQDFVETAAPAMTADGLYELGLVYSAGRDVDADMVAAHKWFNLAAMRGNQEAKLRRMELAHEMSKDQIAAAQRQAREWLRKH